MCEPRGSMRRELCTAALSTPPPLSLRSKRIARTTLLRWGRHGAARDAKEGSFTGSRQHFGPPFSTRSLSSPVLSLMSSASTSPAVPAPKCWMCSTAAYSSTTTLSGKFSGSTPPNPVYALGSLTSRMKTVLGGRSVHLTDRRMGRSHPVLRMVIGTRVPSFAWRSTSTSARSCSDPPWRDVPATSRISSPTRNPARAAGDRSLTAVTNVRRLRHLGGRHSECQSPVMSRHGSSRVRTPSSTRPW
mmetsp:Transcript_31446/g.96175  ORF Transcript_31446/g.96175 Transcript_31446/m.96175 type:complete len:245 (+) Transcript_31446:235-969(+)